MALDVYKDWLGIPEDQRPPDHYQLLRLVQFEDDPERIQANYRKLNAHVRKYASGQYMDESQALLNELAKAMLCLTDADRKRDYDTQFGREFEADEVLGERPPIEQILLQQGDITPAQVEEAAGMCRGLGIDMRDALVQLKAVKAEAAARALAASLGRPYVNLDELTPVDSVMDRVPRSMVKQNSILPLFIDEDDDVLLVACVNPITAEVEDDLRLRFEMPVRDVLATPLAINQAISKYYAPGVRAEGAEEIPVAKKSSRKVSKPKKEKPTRSPEEQAQFGKQVSIIIVCWCFVMAYLLDGFVIGAGGYFDFYSVLLYIFLPLIGAGVAYQMYWPRSR